MPAMDAALGLPPGVLERLRRRAAAAGLPDVLALRDRAIGARQGERRSVGEAVRALVTDGADPDLAAFMEAWAARPRDTAGDGQANGAT